MILALVFTLLVATAAHAQLSTPGAAPAPSPGLPGGVISAPPGVLPAQCVVANPIAGTTNAFILTACPPLSPPGVDNTLPTPPAPCPPASSQLPAPGPTPSTAQRSAPTPKKMCPC